MPEYVYALHNFLPEHEDEVTFHTGEQIEVVEKDDIYGDGWWQGRNLAGKVGLFPVSYTTPVPPSATPVEVTPAGAVEADSAAFQRPREESESESSPAPDHDIPSPTSTQPRASLPNEDEYGSDAGPSDAASLRLALLADGEVMKATMTDVQKAIEQLGRGRTGAEEDGASRFSFASTRDDADTGTDETDFDLSDLDSSATGPSNGQEWHKNARRKLAAKARKAVEDAERLEAMMAGESLSGRRSVAPPFEVEMSDESDEEGDFTRSRRLQRYILEEDENEESQPGTAHGKAFVTGTQDLSSVHDNQVILPAKDETEVSTATAMSLSFPVFSPPSTAIDPTPNYLAEKSTSPTRTSYPTPSPPPPSPPPAAPPLAVIASQVTPSEPNRNSPNVKLTTVLNGLPSPSASAHFNKTANSKHSSLVSSSSAPAMAPPGPQSDHAPLSPLVSKTHATEWSVEEVVEWLKSRGFDQDTCDKFVEQEITGDVLLELDVNLLKTEIGILAFGKRMRIANAIAELRRPPSIEYSGSDHVSSEQPSPMQAHHPHFKNHNHSRTQSQSQSHHSFPGTINPTPGHAYTQSIQSSLGSPWALGFGYGQGSQFEPVQESPDPDRTVDVGVAAGIAAALGVGLGSGVPSAENGRSAQLVTSPSDGALKASAAKSSLAASQGGDDRGHMSDGEIVPSNMSMRRRLFGRSQDSSVSARQASPTPRKSLDKEKDSIKEGKEKKEKEKDKDTARPISVGRGHARGKKSLDAGKHTDRLSIFAGTFGGSLSKSRKPPPFPNDEQHTPEKLSSKLSLPRLHRPSLSIRKVSTTRPTTPPNTQSPKDLSLLSVQDQTPKSKDKESAKDTQTLRKRTVSSPQFGSFNSKENNSVPQAVDGLSGPIKQGQNILEQIGEPDHTGWMRKKGERYNTWKLRYFVLKGPHLYCLKSNNKTETRIKGYIHIVGYKVTVDENIDPGRYGFRIDHDQDKTYYFSSEEKIVIRDWMKAIMKATIGRDYTKPVVSSCNIPTIPLVVAQAMNPAPRPPSPTARDATQKALRRDNPDQLSSRDARILMGLAGTDSKDDQQRTRLDSFFSEEDDTLTNDLVSPQPSSPKRTSVPPRPSREMRRSFSQRVAVNDADNSLIDWANSHLPEHLQITDPTGSLCGGLALLRLAESIKGRPSSPPVADSAFPADANDDKLDGLFKLFDFLLDNDVKLGSLSINDVRQGKRDKIIQLIRALKTWEDKRKALAITIANKGSINQGAGNASAFAISVALS